MERTSKKRGSESGNAGDEREGHFLCHCCGRERRVSQQRERGGGIKQGVTEMERLRNNLIMEDTYVKRDGVVRHVCQELQFAGSLATSLDSSSFPHHPLPSFSLYFAPFKRQLYQFSKD